MALARRVLVAAGGAAVVAALGAPVAARACAATTGMVLGTAHAPSGTNVSVRGSNFAPGAPVEVRWGSPHGPLLATAIGGDFATQVTIPEVAPGLYSIDTTDNTGPIAFISATFTVTAPVAQRNLGQQGSASTPPQTGLLHVAPPAPAPPPAGSATASGSPTRASAGSNRAVSRAGIAPAAPRGALVQSGAPAAAAPIGVAPLPAVGSQSAAQVPAAGQPAGSTGLRGIPEGFGPFRGKAAPQPAALAGGGPAVATALFAVGLPFLLICAAAVGVVRTRRAASVKRS